MHLAETVRNNSSHDPVGAGAGVVADAGTGAAGWAAQTCGAIHKPVYIATASPATGTFSAAHISGTYVTSMVGIQDLGMRPLFANQTTGPTDSTYRNGSMATMSKSATTVTMPQTDRFFAFSFMVGLSSEWARRVNVSRLDR